MTMTQHPTPADLDPQVDDDEPDENQEPEPGERAEVAAAPSVPATVDPAHAALDAAARAAVEMPGIPGRDEFLCVPDRAEALTKRGWLGPDKLAPDDEVLAYDGDTGKCRWVPVIAVSRYEAAQTYRVGNRQWSAVATANHRWLVERRTSTRAYRRQMWATEDLAAPTGRLVLAAAAEMEEASALTDRDAAILGWVLTDGYIGREKIDSLSVVISQAKHVEEVRALLGADASAYLSEPGGPKMVAGKLCENTLPCWRFRLRSPFARGLLARAGIRTKADAMAVLPRIGTTAKRAMFDAMVAANGSETGTVMEFSTGHDAVLDLFQGLATTLGIPLGTARRRGNCWLVSTRRSAGVSLSTLSVTPHVVEPVWCPTTETGTWVCRLDGQVFITGNSLCMQARILSMSALAPRALKDKPHDTLMILLVGRDLQIPTTSALKQVYVVDGQPSLAPKLLNARIRRMGLGSVVPAVKTPERAVAVALAPGGRIDPRCRQSWPTHMEGCECRGVMGDQEFTWKDAQRTGMVRRDCQAEEHSEECIKDSKASDRAQRGRACKDNYVHYPQRMLWWRAAGYVSDDYFPEASLGVYSPDELGAMTDEDGQPIDVESVEVPDGFRPKELAPPEEATDEERQALKRRIDALPSDGRNVLKMMWQGKDPATGEQRDGVAPLHPWNQLLRGEHVRAKAYVATIEDRAKKGEWGAWEPPADPETGKVAAPDPTTPTDPPASPPESAPPAPEAPAPPDTPDPAPPAPEAHTAAGPPAPDPAPADPTTGLDLTDRIIGEVKAMKAAQVMAELVKRQYNPEGVGDADRRQELASRMLRERLEEGGR